MIDLDETARRAAAGDRAALEALLARISPMVLRQCGRFLPCRQDAEEAAQDALLQLTRSIGSYQGRSRFTTWLHVLVANSARQTYRSLRRRSREQALPVVLLDAVDPHSTSVTAGSRVDLLDALERLEDQHPDLARVLVLRDLCELDYDDIAGQLGIPVGTVRSRVHRARQQMRQTLTAY